MYNESDVVTSSAKCHQDRRIDDDSQFQQRESGHLARADSLNSDSDIHQPEFEFFKGSESWS